MVSETKTKLVVLDPTAAADVVAARTVPRLATLDGKRIGLLDNHKNNAGEFLGELFALLSQQYKLPPPVTAKKPNGSAPAPTKTLDELAAQCDLVITAMGD